MGRESGRWHSERLGREIHLVRWGEIGTPVLFYPTAGGDAEECERFLMIDALGPLLEAGRIKLYSIDAVGTRTVLEEGTSREHAAWVQNRFDEAVYREVVPAIRADCKSESIELIACGASLGAWNSLAAICRHPYVFKSAICMSGTYDLSRWIPDNSGEWRFCQPLMFLRELDGGAHLDALRKRFVVLAHGTGRWESPRESWRAADLLGSKGIPNRVDEWGGEWDHDWPTWRRMLPQYLGELA